MKTVLPKEIKTREEAEKFLKDLIENDEIFHPEDDANKVMTKKGRLFTQSEALELNILFDQIYDLQGFDAAQFILDERMKMV